MRYATALMLVLAFLPGCTSIPEIHNKTPTVADMERLGRLASKGRMEAIDELALTANKLYEKRDNTDKNKPAVDNLTLMRAAFTPIGTMAGKGSKSALAALDYANGNRRLRSFTSDAYGIAAGMGNTDALNILLNYKGHGFLLSSTVFALQDAGNKNVPEAVAFLVDVINDPNRKPLWHAASEGLFGAVSLGNIQAAEGVKKFAAYENSLRTPEEIEKKRCREESKATAMKLRAIIVEEINSIGKHPWAGEYYTGDGLGMNVSFLLAPQSGYLFEWHGCLGLYDRNYGPITFSNGTIELTFTFENVQEGFRGIAKEFVPVAWGKRSYLIPADDMVGFCNEVNGRTEPRDDMHGRYLLRLGDEKKKVSGFPSVPDSFRNYLLIKPIEAEIIAIGSYTTRPSRCDWKFKDTEVTLDKGRAAGILTGMRLNVYDPEHLVEDVMIKSVNEKTAKGIIRQIGTNEPEPKIGWKVSTRLPWKMDEK